MISKPFISKEILSERIVAQDLGCDLSDLDVYYNDGKSPDVAAYFFEKRSLRTEVYSIQTGEKLHPEKVYVKDGECVYLELTDKEGNGYSYVSHSQRDLIKQISDDNREAASKHPQVAEHFEEWKGFENRSDLVANIKQQASNHSLNPVGESDSYKQVQSNTINRII